MNLPNIYLQITSRYIQGLFNMPHYLTYGAAFNQISFYNECYDSQHLYETLIPNP